MNWLYKDKIVTSRDIFPENSYGFIYLITDIQTNKKYIGQKKFDSVKRKPLTKKQKLSGRKRRDVIVSESNWMTYTSSSVAVKELIKSKGIDNFKFEILMVAETKGQLNYAEQFCQFISHSLLKDNYINDAVGAGKFRTIKVDAHFLDILDEVKKIFD